MLAKKRYLLVAAGKWTAGVAAGVAIATVTALITGQSLTGLRKISVMWHAIAHGSVPAWTLFASLILLLCGACYFLAHPPGRRSQGKVHFVPDSHNSGWSATPDGQMSVTLGGTLTYEGEGALTVLKAFPKGTQPVTDMAAQVTVWAPGPQWASIPEIHLEGQPALRVFLLMNLRPSIGRPGRALRSRVVLRDKYNRDFPVGPVEFQYRGSH